jgi:hypothetical protein
MPQAKLYFIVFSCHMPEARNDNAEKVGASCSDIPAIAEMSLVNYSTLRLQSCLEVHSFNVKQTVDCNSVRTEGTN